MNCIICKTETKPYKQGVYPQTCSPDCLSKLRSINASKAIKEGKIPRPGKKLKWTVY